MEKGKGSEFIERLNTVLHQSPKDALQKICEDLSVLNESYNWVGIYVIKRDKLILESFAGEKTEHEQISLGDGLCSMAIVLNAVVNEPDVKSNSKYLACFPSTRSEIVVPIRYNNKAIGEIDIDSDKVGAFNKADETFLTTIAQLISEKVFELYIP